MFLNKKIIRFPEKGGNCEPCEMIPIPLLETSLWCGTPTDFPDLGKSPFSEHVLVPAGIVQNPQETFAFKIKGDSMEPLLFEDECLIVDCSPLFRYSKAMNEIVVAWYDDGFTVKWLRSIGEDVFLVPENPNGYETKKVSNSSNFFVAGVVIYLIKAESIKDIVANRKSFQE